MKNYRIRTPYSTYRVYGRAFGNADAKVKCLFSISAHTAEDARKQTKRRVKGVYTITRIVKEF